MIYVYKKDNSIILSQISRNIEDSYENENDEFFDTVHILTLNWDYDKTLPIIHKGLRRWKNLSVSDDYCYNYCDEVLNWFNKFKNEKPTSNETLKFVWDKDISLLEKDFLQAKKKLEEVGLIEKTDTRSDDTLRKNIKYECDIWNYFDEIYSKEVSHLVEEYLLLSDKKKKFISDFYNKLTKESKLEFLKNKDSNIDVSEILEFLPQWCIFSLVISDLLVSENNEVNISVPEFKNDTKIDKKDRLRRFKVDWIRKEIYKTFKINSVWKGPDIKKKLEEIYRMYEYPFKASILDINEYFEISKTRVGYRIGFRKNNYVL